MDAGTGLLGHARQLVNLGWTQHADARDADGSPVRPWDTRAASWSLLGALVAAVECIAAVEGEQAAISELAHTCIQLADFLDADSLEQWNDSPGRTSNDVLAALDRAATRTAKHRHEPDGFSPD
jgi:hypothetical protein